MTPAVLTRFDELRARLPNPRSGLTLGQVGDLFRLAELLEDPGADAHTVECLTRRLRLRPAGAAHGSQLDLLEAA